MSGDGGVPSTGGFLGGTGIAGAPGARPSGAWGNTTPPGDTSQTGWNNQRQAGVADDVDFEVKGHDLQFIEVELDPGDSCVAEAGSLMYKEAAIGMETIFGDGSAEEGGLLGKLWTGAKRALSGSTWFMTKFTHNGQGKARVAFSAPYPGLIIPLKLDQYGGEILCQRDTFLAGARGVKIDVAFQRKLMTGFFGGEGFVMQRLAGDGWVFVHGGGTVVERQLAPGEELHVETGCLVAQTSSVSFDVVPVGGVKSILFGGSGFFFARLVGPGHVWLQSMPFSRLAGAIAARIPARAETRVGPSFNLGGGGSESESGSSGSWGGDSGGDTDA